MTENWIVQIDSQLEKMKDPATGMEQLWEKRSIYRIPSQVTDANKEAYKPRVASFGPYHHGEHHLRPMEEHKQRALLHFLKRSGKQVVFYIDALAEVLQDLKDAYDQLDIRWQKDERAFLQLMLLDGCFILEIMITTLGFDSGYYAPNDPIFSAHGKLHILPLLISDMSLLENQMPFLVLQTLFAGENENFKRSENRLNNLIRDFFSTCSLTYLGNSPYKPIYMGKGKSVHILDVYRKSLLLMKPRPKRLHKRRFLLSDYLIPTATELIEAGIQLKRSKHKRLTNISFHGQDLHIPSMIVDEETERLFLNIIAFERSHVGAGNEVTAYIFFMDSIIKSANDVELLKKRGIINNVTGSSQDVAKLFRSLSKGFTLVPETELYNLHYEINQRLKFLCSTKWHQCISNLMKTYFKSPWAIVSVIAAFLALTLSMIQTLYTVLSYVNRKH